MTLGVLLDKINYYSAKDKRGKTFKITEFNTLLPTVQDALYAEELGKLLVGDVQNIPESRLSISPLRVFKYQQSYTVDDGNAAIPTDYVRYISVSNDYHEVTVVTESEYNKRRTSVYRRPIIRPFCYFTATDIVPCPTNLGQLTLQYLRKPTTPYYDYCQDADTLNEIFMPVGSFIAYDTGTSQYILYDPSTATTLNDNVTKDGVVYVAPSAPVSGGGGTLSDALYTSLTVELQWEDIYHDQFVLAMLALVGINIDKAELTQYAEAKQK